MLKIDEANGVVVADGPDGEVTHRLDSPEAFRLISNAWVPYKWHRPLKRRITPQSALPRSRFLQELSFSPAPHWQTCLNPVLWR